MESSLTSYTMEVEYYRPNSNSAEDNDASIYWLRVLSTSLGIWPQKLVGDKKQWWKRLYYFMIIMHWYNTYLQVEFFFHNLGALKTMTELTAFTRSLRTFFQFAPVLRTAFVVKMSSVRKNTLLVDFNVLPVRPDVAKVQHFLENEISLNLADVNSIQLHNTRNCVYIEMKDGDTALRYEKANNLKRSFVYKDKPFKIPVYVDSGAVTVRVCDLPPSMPHATVGNYMMRFGDVLSIQNERWKNYFGGVYNGVRVLQMRLKQSIPSFIIIENQTATVLHQNQTKTCKYCSRAVHPNQKCLEVTAAENAINSTVESTPLSVNKTTTLDETEFPPMQPASSSRDTFSEILARAKRSLDEDEAKSSNSITLPTVDSKQQTSNNNADDDDDGSGHDNSSCDVKVTKIALVSEFDG